MEHQLVIFELSSEFFGVNIASVESIIKMQSITAIPHSPSFVEGITNLRGSILPVVDLHKRFHLAGSETDKDSRIVVANIGGTKVGMIVDAVSEVLRVNDEAIEPPPPMVSTLASVFITGIAKVADRLVMLLDLNKVLSIQEQNRLLEFAH